MKRANNDIREYCKEKGVKLWEVAEKVGISDGNFSRKMRKPFSEEYRNKIMRIIRNIADHREEE